MALVIGNDAYPWKPLRNAVNDAKALAATLPKTGFDPKDVTLVTNASLKQMQKAGRDFLEKLRPDDLALVVSARPAHFRVSGGRVSGRRTLI